MVAAVAHGANNGGHARRGIADAPVLLRRRLLQSSLPSQAPQTRRTARLLEAELSGAQFRVWAAAGLLAAAALMVLVVAVPALAKAPLRNAPPRRIVYTAPWPSTPVITLHY